MMWVHVSSNSNVVVSILLLLHQSSNAAVTFLAVRYGNSQAS